MRARDGVLGGVCRGFAQASGLDLTLVRLAFVAAGLTGFGVLAYLVLWVVVSREDPSTGRTLVPAPPDTARWLQVGLLAGGVIGLLSLGWRWSFGWFDPFPWHGPSSRGPGLFFGLLLVAVGVAVIWFRRREDGRADQWRSSRDGVAPLATAGAASAPATPWPAPMPGGGPSDATAPTAASAPTAPTAPTSAPIAEGEPPKPPAPRLSGGVVAARVIAWLAVIAAILATAATAVLTFVVGAVSLALPGLAGAALILAIVAVSVAAIVARTVWPVVLSLALLVGAVGLTMGLGSWDGEVGEQVVRPSSVTEVQPTYDFAVGRFVLDLSGVAIAEGTVPLSVDQGAGRLDVLVPNDVAVDARVEVLGGEARVLGRVEEGVGIELDVVDVVDATSSEATSSEAGPRAGGRLDLQIDLGFGQVNVCRAGTPNAQECASD